MTCNVAFIGLGVMGYPMASYISKAGHNVTVFNRTKSKTEKWISEYKGKVAETPAEAKAAIKSGVARKKIKNFDIYTDQLKQRLDPSVTIMQGINSQIKKTQKRIVFTDGEDQNTLKAAIAFKKNGLGIPVLIADEKVIKERLKEIGYSENFDIEIVNSKSKGKIEKYSKYIFNKLHGTKNYSS